MMDVGVVVTAVGAGDLITPICGSAGALNVIGVSNASPLEKLPKMPGRWAP